MNSSARSIVLLLSISLFAPVNCGGNPSITEQTGSDRITFQPEEGLFRFELPSGFVARRRVNKNESRVIYEIQPLQAEEEFRNQAGMGDSTEDSENGRGGPGSGANGVNSGNRSLLDLRKVHVELISVPEGKSPDLFTGTYEKSFVNGCDCNILERGVVNLQGRSARHYRISYTDTGRSGYQRHLALDQYYVIIEITGRSEKQPQVNELFNMVMGSLNFLTDS